MSATFSLSSLMISEGSSTFGGPPGGAQCIFRPPPSREAYCRMISSYRLFVSQTRYEMFGLPVEVTGDLTIRAELSLEPVLERN